MHPKALKELVLDTIEERQGQDVRCMDVRLLTEVFDYMIVVSGNSTRHVRALTDRLVERCTEQGQKPLGVEGREPGDWVLIDLVHVVIHVMLPAAREFYDLEGIWCTSDPAAIS